MKKYQKKPYFMHDCNSCVFLGRFRKHDLYVCLHKGKKIDTVLGRWSSEGADYYSGLEFALFAREGLAFARTRSAKRNITKGSRILLEALKRAEALGYYV